MSSSAAALLSGVKGDLKKMEDKSARERARAKAKSDVEKAAAQLAMREQLYRDSGARKGFYPPVSANGEFLVWPKQGAWRLQVPDDRASPRVATRSYQAPNASSASALQAFVKESGLNLVGGNFEPLESYKNLDGRDVQILLAETRMNERTGIAFVFYARSRSSSSSSLRVLELPAKTYQAWGGVAGMLTMRGVVPGIDVFPASERQRIARSPLKEQIVFYEAVLDKFYLENALALMLTQAQTTAMMTELNYDLLFGNDITPGPWAD